MVGSWLRTGNLLHVANKGSLFPFDQILEVLDLEVNTADEGSDIIRCSVILIDGNMSVMISLNLYLENIP